ncbi:MAG: beta-N-acetylhexosaminidase [Clostridia bacterium]|nr:beta-N-acetylhexosaminidase [Clostridia bacterium]
MKLFITPADSELEEGLKLLSAVSDVDVVCDEAAADVTVTVTTCDKGLKVSYDGVKTASIAYSRRVEFFRGVSYLLGGKAVEAEETAHFESNGFMLDCSRNAAPTLDTVKETLARMALMGLNMMQLYTEDMYILEDRPYFGYMRGRYTDEELKAVDDTAYALGIEVVPCIQTLAHLATVLRWSAFSDLIDCNDIMMAGEDSTYAFVTEMIAKMRRCFRSRRINIGMDEAHMIGLGNYMKKHGVRPRVDIMCEHIARVLDICKDYDFTPMMWSDMFFHLAGGSYNDASTKIDEAIIEKVPEGVSLVYWEYYCDDKNKYDTVLKQHLQFKNPIVFAGCAWKWNGLLPELKFSLAASRAALTQCLNNGIATVFATAWGDDGAECPLNVVLPVLQLYAELDYHGGDVSDEFLSARFADCTGADLADFLLLDKPNRTTENQPAIGLNPTKYLLYQDVMQGLFDAHVAPHFPAFYAATRDELKAAGERHPRYQYLFEYEASLCDLLSVKSTIGVDLRAAYLKGDREELARLANEVLPVVSEKLQAFVDLYYDGWMKENKPFGFDTVDLRLGGLQNRIATAKKRVNAYLDGKVAMLEEFDEVRLSFDNRADDPHADPNTFCNTWTRIATASLI